MQYQLNNVVKLCFVFPTFGEVLCLINCSLRFTQEKGAEQGLNLTYDMTCNMQVNKTRLSLTTQITTPYVNSYLVKMYTG